LKVVFDSGEKESSRVNTIEDGAIFAVHIDKIVAPRVKPLGDVKDRVVAAWQAEQKQQAVKKKADEIVVAVAAGTPLAKAAADKGVTATTSPPLGRRRVARIRSSVVLPAPFGPSTTSESPAASVSPTPSSAVRSP